jgi:polyphosphate:AMP phosphotransferase
MLFPIGRAFRMFEAAELGQKVSKSDYRKEVPDLRMSLLRLQYELRAWDFPVILVLSGNDRGSSNEVLNLMHEWMDPRFIQANAWAAVSDEERERPLFWRYWRGMPPRGRIGVYLHAWTVEAIMQRLLGEIDDAGYARLIDHVRRHERMLIDDGALLLKFWFHLPEKKMRKRLEAAVKGDEPRMMVTRKEARVLLRDYGSVISTMEEALRGTSDADAPWHVIESTDDRFRNLTSMKLLESELSRRLDEARPAAASGKKKRAAEPVENPVTVLDKVDLSVSLSKDDYEKSLKRWQRKLTRLTRETYEKDIATVLVFEGWDAAGKGGVVRRICAAMDASFYSVVPIAAPTEEERAQHYLWRFWRQLPRDGRVTIFDRSWYGRVMVERVEGIAAPAEWRRAYAEINDFEEQITEHGTVLLKFWLHIDPDEQLRRFEAREQTPFKKYKITKEDYRNRERWNEYEAAVDEMIRRTSTDSARWHVLAANDKRWARIHAIKTLCRSLSAALKKAGT